MTPTSITGNTKLIALMNGLLPNEYAARNQYVAHEELAKFLGFGKFAEWIKTSRREAEEEHIRELHKRIREIGGVPVADKLGKIAAEEDLLKSLDADDAAEVTAVETTKAAARFAHDCGDFTTRDILDHIAAEEEDHLSGIRQYRKQLELIGAQNFLSLFTT